MPALTRRRAGALWFDEETRRHHRHHPGGRGTGGRRVLLGELSGGRSCDPPPAPEHRQAPGGTHSAPSVKPTLPSSLPLKLPPGFAISIFAKELPAPGSWPWTPRATFWSASPPRAGWWPCRIKTATAWPMTVVTVLDGLNHPHGLAFGPGKAAPALCGGDRPGGGLRL